MQVNQTKESMIKSYYEMHDLYLSGLISTALGTKCELLPYVATLIKDGNI